MTQSPSLTARALTLGLVKFLALVVVFFACFAFGGSLVASALPTNTPEPGPLPPGGSDR